MPQITLPTITPAWPGIAKDATTPTTLILPAPAPPSKPRRPNDHTRTRHPPADTVCGRRAVRVADIACVLLEVFGMSQSLTARARQLFECRRNGAKWVRAVRYLRSRNLWLLDKEILRKETQQRSAA